MPSPRVLKMTFEFHVPEGLNTDIRFARVEAAAAAFEGSVRALASTDFPWADRIVVDREWSYRWWHPEPTDEALPPTSKNTITGGDTQQQALAQAIKGSDGVWHASRTVEALATAGLNVTEKRARDLLRRLASDGLIEKIDGGRGVYRLADDKQ